MNTIAIAIKALTTKRDAAQEIVNNLNLAIQGLGGGTNAGPGKAVARRSKGKAGGWPKGKKRGRKVASDGAGASAGTVPDNVDVIPADLQAEIDAIKANPKLKGIQIAQAVRKAKIAYFKGPSTGQGAGLAEAAAS